MPPKTLRVLVWILPFLPTPFMYTFSFGSTFESVFTLLQFQRSASWVWTEGPTASNCMTFQTKTHYCGQNLRQYLSTANPFRLVLLGLAIYRVYKVYKRCVSQIKGRIFQNLPADTLQSKSIFFYCWWMSFPLDDSNKRTHYLRKLLHSFFIRTFLQYTLVF